MYFLPEPSLNHLAFIFCHIPQDRSFDIYVDPSVIVPKIPDIKQGCKQFLTIDNAQSFILRQVTLRVQAQCQTISTLVNDLSYLALILHFLISCDSFPCNRGIDCLGVAPLSSLCKIITYSTQPT